MWSEEKLTSPDLAKFFVGAAAIAWMCRATWALHANHYVNEFYVGIDGTFFNKSYVQGIQNGLAIEMILWDRFECSYDKNLLDSSCKKIYS